MNLKNFINKILWDKRENKENYSFFYIDRIERKEKEIKGKDIIKSEGNFIIVGIDNSQISVPMHRIKTIKKKGAVVWSKP